jgi:hypothetical protein
MDDGRLDRIEQALYRSARLRAQSAVVPQDFTARIMCEVRGKNPARIEFWDVFGLVARRFAPVGALAATGALGYAQVMERVLNQALVSLSLHGGGNALTLAGLMP